MSPVFLEQTQIVEYHYITSIFCVKIIIIIMMIRYFHTLETKCFSRFLFHKKKNIYWHFFGL